MSSRSLDDLHPLFKPKAQDFLEAAQAAGLDVLIYCTLRGVTEQNELYTHGRTAPGSIVTNARGGQSAHNFGLAFDGVPMIAGKPAWNDHDAWTTYGHVASAVGLEWAGTWIRFVEKPHIQMPKWQLIAGVA
jgi:peptidoglycan L-alanyl-D-glutamate endopeptidase CwlK